jgi:hypothetical protein
MHIRQLELLERQRAGEQSNPLLNQYLMSGRVYHLRFRLRLYGEIDEGGTLTWDHS